MRLLAAVFAACLALPAQAKFLDILDAQLTDDPLAAALAACLALPAQAKVPDIVDTGFLDGPKVDIQNGFTFNNSSGHKDLDDSYLHDDGGKTSSTSLRADGRRFGMGRARSGVGSSFEEFQSDGTLRPIGYGYSLTGFRDGVQVASIVQKSGSFGPQSWRSVLSDLTSFPITLPLPPDRIKYAHLYGEPITYSPESVVCDWWCANAHVDDIDHALAPVPIPASLPLLLAGLGGVGLIARRKKR